MSEHDTYTRAKLAEISGALERLNTVLNRMIDVVSKIGEIQDAAAQIAAAVATNSRKLDEFMQTARRMPLASVSGTGSSATDEKAGGSPLQAILDTLDSQIREGAIASDLAQIINETAETIEQKGAGAPLVVRMQRWTRILKTYGRVDPISPTDLRKLRDDLKDWQREIAKAK